MNTRVDIDQAIDRVAKQLTHVEASPVFAAGLVAALPDRVGTSGWIVRSWALRLAVVALVAISSVVYLTRVPGQGGSPLLRANVVRGLTTLRASVEPSAPGDPGTQPLEPLERLEPLQSGQDHEFSLPALDVEALAPMNRPAEVSIELAPLAIADLPLSGEFPEKP